MNRLFARASLIPLGLLAVSAIAMLLDRTALAVALGAIALVLIALLVVERILRRDRRPPGPGFRYVLVEPDGTARELTAEEQVYVETRFEFGDGAAPYFKPWFNHRNPRGDLGGFLRREQVPPGIVIHPAPTSGS